MKLIKASWNVGVGSPNHVQVGDPSKIIKIEYHEPRGEGDAHYVDAYTDTKMFRHFRPDTLIFDLEDHEKVILPVE